MRVAVITPYWREPATTLERCRDSVRKQSFPCRHIMVADGFPSDAIDSETVDHIVLPVGHGDNGNTPRCIGALTALNRGFDAFAFLDADNWFAEDHVASLVDVLTREGADVAISDRQIVLSTGEVSPYEDLDVVERRFADTSCFLFSARAAHLLPVWGMMDQVLSPICDRVMIEAIRSRGAHLSWSGRKTLFYESRWPSHFEALGKAPPNDAHHTDWDGMRGRYSPQKQRERLGFDPYAGRSPFEGHRFQQI